MRKLLRYLFPRRPMEPLIAVVGATGTGKSKLAVDLASRFNGEIINGDAMQMYRGLPIITNQIPIEERNGIPHHLISCIDLHEETWRVGTFRNESLRIIKDIHARGKVPVLVGGTHYYTQSVLFKDHIIEEGAREDEELSRKSVDGADDSAIKWPILDAPTEVVLQKLREVDPVMANRWHPNDGRKIRRSLEIYFQTGRPASEVYAEQKRQRQTATDADDPMDIGQLRFPTIIFWVHSEKEVLNARLDKRVDNMINQGLLSEARRMSDYLREREAQGEFVDRTRGVWISIGFKELAPYFEEIYKGTSSDEELDTLKISCIESVKTATRQYAGSQIKWIRNKLWTAMAESGMKHRLYLLDSTDVDDWTNSVAEPSESLVQRLLNGETTPDPKSLSVLAQKTLEAKEAQEQNGPNPDPKCFTCEICNKTMTTQDQWNIHLNGQAHKRAVKGVARRAERDEYLRKRQEAQENIQQSSA